MTEQVPHSRIRGLGPAVLRLVAVLGLVIVPTLGGAPAAHALTYRLALEGSYQLCNFQAPGPVEGTCDEASLIFRFPQCSFFVHATARTGGDFLMDDPVPVVTWTYQVTQSPLYRDQPQNCRHQFRLRASNGTTVTPWQNTPPDSRFINETRFFDYRGSEWVRYLDVRVALSASPGTWYQMTIPIGQEKHYSLNVVPVVTAPPPPPTTTIPWSPPPPACDPSCCC